MRCLALGSGLALLAVPVQPAAAQVQTERSEERVEQESAGPDIEVIGLTSGSARAGLFGDQAIADTPFSITAYTSELIATQQARNITDVTANDPAVRNNLSANSGNEQFTIRGFPLFASEIAAEGLYGMVPVRRTVIEPFDRIEVFKGPNALVNGLPPFGNIGGIINVVPKRAEARPTTTAGLYYQSEGHVGGRMDLGRRFGAEGAFGVRVDAARYSGDLALDDADARHGVAAAAFDYRSGGLTATVDLLYTADRLRGYDNIVTVAAGFDIPDAPDAKTNYNQPWLLTTNRYLRALGGVTYKFAPGTSLGVRYGHSDYDETFRFATLTLLAADGRATGTPTLSRFPTIVDTGDATLQTRFDTGPLTHALSISANSFLSRQGAGGPLTGQTAFTTNIYAPVATPRPATLFGEVGAALAADDRLSARRLLRGGAIADAIEALNGRIRATIGLRYQALDIANYVYATGAVSTRYKEDRLTPAVALLVKPADDLSIYGSFSQGLTPGPFAPLGTTNAGVAFAPFVSTQYEVGAKLEHGSVSGTIAAFRVNQPFDYVNATTNTFVLDGDIVNKGVELNVSGRVTDELTLLGGVARYDATQRNTAGGANDGRQAIGVPKWQLNLFSEWAPEALGGFAVNGRIIHTSSQFYDAANTRDIPSWTRIDLGGRVSFDLGGTAMTLRAAVENVADRNYWQSTNRSFLTRGMARTSRLTVEAAF